MDTNSISILQRARHYCDRLVAEIRLPAQARAVRRRDLDNAVGDDPGSRAIIEAATAWLCRAQDQSSSHDGGVAHHFSLTSGWSSSYPETTGYILPTFLDLAARTGRADLRVRALRMLDWFVAIQLENGAFQGGRIDSQPVVPVVFNTGQILLGLAAGFREFGAAYHTPLYRAADWLLSVQDSDGCWRKGDSPFALAGHRVYDTHVAWGLLEAARVSNNKRYADSALSNIRWALTQQQTNGWFANCCLSDPREPLTHTLGYALRGLLEGYLYERDSRLLERARRTADGLLGALREDGFLPGLLASDWSARSSWACLTGTVQVAHCWLLMFKETGDERYLLASRSALTYVRRRVHTSGSEDTRGAVKGSFPINGDYVPYAYPNWATKFLIDASLLEQDILSAASRSCATG